MLDQEPVAWAVMLSPAIPRYIGITAVDLQTRCLVEGSKRGRNLSANLTSSAATSSRQLARAGEIWSQHLTERALVLDLEEIKAKAKKPMARGRPRKQAPAA